MKYAFYDDYSEGAHPKVLAMLGEQNLKQETGYGLDSFCKKAANIIKKEIGNSKADVHFVSGGTQANIIALTAMLRPYESVISATTGHINFHEAGALEATGHKINIVDTPDGKLNVEKLQEVLDGHPDEHMVKPKVVYVSNATELGTVYSKKELEKISSWCSKNDLYFFLDGARLATAICSEGSDLTLQDVAKLTDAFYIGGTKNGALCGEAIVIVNPDLKVNFRYHIKQKGALLAKGRLLGLQFVALFEDGLFYKLANHANAMAKRLRIGIEDLEFKFLTKSSNNQIFPILPMQLIKKLQKNYGFYIWQKIDSKYSAVRLVTSWATKEEMVDEFIKDLKKLV